MSTTSSYLNSFVNFESQLHKLQPEDFDLNRIEKLLDLAGNPAKDLKIVHVAGTKGKGSTSAFLASILQEAGYKVGLYTSPHLLCLNERIRVLKGRSQDDFSGAISDEDLDSVLTFLRPFCAAIQNEGHILTFFEVMTVLALCFFARVGVDVVILETGLGGRLDATNAVDSLIAVITPISLDHTKILGTTLSKIASEKAGIIKNSHQQVVVAPQEKQAMDVILERCREFGIEPVWVREQNLNVGLKGKHQVLNASAAVEATKLLRTMGFKITDETIRDGLKYVRWPGRFELLSKNPDLIVDCAHNEASAQALANTLKEIYPQQRVILILGISQDKDIGAICEALSSAHHILLTKANHPRAHTFTLAEGINYFKATPVEVIENLDGALKRAWQLAGPQDKIVVAGSIFIVAEAKILCINTKV